MEFISIFSFILTHIMLGLVSPGSAKADIGWGETKTLISQLCQKYFCQKFSKSANLSSSYDDNVGNVFQVFCLFQYMFRLICFRWVVQEQTLIEVGI